MTVIDISTYQGAVDFAQVRAAGVGRVIAKMGGGDAGVYVDTEWAANRAGIRAQGLALGSYFFNGPGDTPTQAADFQFANIDHQPGDWVVIDVEGHGIAYTPAQADEWAARMLWHGVPASDLLIYMSRSVENSEDFSQIKALGVLPWIADYGANTGQPGTPPHTVNWPSWALWQYTSNGSIPGVAGRVDLSIASPSFADTKITPLTTQEDTMLIIDGGLTATRKAIALAGGPGGWHVFSGTEWNLFKMQHNIPALLGLQTVQPVNDAAWDIFATIYAPAALYVNPDLSSVLSSITAAVAALEANETTDQQAVLSAIHSAVLANPSGPVDLTPVLSAITALSSTDTGYVQQVEAILAKGLTVTGTAVPAA